MPLKGHVGLLAMAAALIPGCGGGGFSESDGRQWVERVIKETPRVGQVMFELPTAPVSPYNADGSYPAWVGAVTYQRFTWTRVSKEQYRAQAIAEVTPGAALRDPARTPPVAARVTVELTVEFAVHRTPPPVMFMPAGENLTVTRWTLQRVDARVVNESGGFVDYTAQ